MKKILIHGSGHKADSWRQTVSHMAGGEDILCPELSVLLRGRPASFENLSAGFAEYCGRLDGPLHLCGLSLGGILALDYALRFPERMATLALIGTPDRIPRLAFALQNLVFRLLPRSAFASMAFDKRDTFALGGSMAGLDLGSRAEEVRCPALVLCGEKDRANLPAARRLAETIPGAELRVLPGAGHVVNEEAPAELARLLDGFYARHGRTP